MYVSSASGNVGACKRPAIADMGGAVSKGSWLWYLALTLPQGDLPAI